MPRSIAHSTADLRLVELVETADTGRGKGFDKLNQPCLASISGSSFKSQLWIVASHLELSTACLYCVRNCPRRHASWVA